MKTVGLLGGMSWESTALYYRLLNEGTKARLGGLHSARCIIHSVDFAEIETMQHKGRWDEAGSVLAAAAEGLEAAGVELLILCTNTMHIVADAIEAAVSIPFLHLADTTAHAVCTAGLSRVGLLGTAFTMEKAFYIDRLSSHNLDVIVPNQPDRKIVHDVIFDELCVGIIKDESRVEFERIIADLVSRGAQGIVAGCTEIELLINKNRCTVPLFETAALHVQAALDQALA